VLTGDKIETAVNIGFSAGLLDDSVARCKIDILEPLKIQGLLEQTLGGIGVAKHALVISGDSLTVI
jgi:magnesium-transporting ATPase (P-type)